MSQTPTAAPTAQTTNQNPAPQPPASGSAQATPAEIRKMKLKLDGQDVEMAESEVIALAQQGKVSGKRFQEAAALRKQAEDVIKFAKENPKEFFAKTGMNAREWAENFLMDELKREQMTPEQKKASENEEKLRKYEQEEKQKAERDRQKHMDELQAQHTENYNKLFVDALNKSGLPKTAYTIKRMAELQLLNVKLKTEIPAEKLATLVREDYIKEQMALFGALEGDQLLEMFGPEIVKKLSKAQIAKLKAKGVRAASGSSPASSEASQPQMTWAEYRKRNRRLT